MYINTIIDETNTYEYTTDIFIHTNNVDLHVGMFNTYTNGDIKIIYHDVSTIHPFYLTWKCRELLQEQRNDYDIFMYIEDDILVPYKAIQYWLQYNQFLLEMNYNVGFLRIEVEDGIEYITDLCGEVFDTCIELHGKKYCVNNKNPYCAFWIYNKHEFNTFVDSTYYNMNTISGYGIREQSAIGLHGIHTGYYKHTLIPVVNNTLIEECKIYHMPNNYVRDKHTSFATIQFNKAFNFVS